MSLIDNAKRRNEAWAAKDLERPLRTLGDPAAHTSIDGARVWQFASSDYLGLGHHPDVIEAGVEATRRFGASAAGSRLTMGLELHAEAERRLAAFFQAPAAVLFPTGFQANVSVIQTLADEGVTIFSDDRNHASIIDGCRISRAKVHRYPHLDFEALDRACAHSDGQPLIVSDAVFSMSGEVVDLDALREVCRARSAWLLLDDAHGVGCLGPRGGGVASMSQGGCLDPSAELIVGTGSKALGGIGGFVLCHEELARLLRNQARGYVFSTAHSPGAVASLIAALEVIALEPWRLQQLQDRIKLVSGILGGERNHGSPIVPVPIGDEATAMLIHAELRERGWLVPAIRYPTVPRGEAMLRVTVTNDHPTEILAAMASDIAECRRKHLEQAHHG